MKLEGEGKLLRIFIGEADRAKGRALYEAIVTAAREKKMAGATVLRGVEGFGARSHVHTARILRLSEDLPLVIEIIDSEQKIREFLADVDSLIDSSGGGALVTLEKVEIIRYTHGGS
jgi:PII-like signaling protein